MRRKTILVVDDEHDILDIIEYNLVKEGYQVIKSDNGSESLALATQFRPDLIILDIMMPGLDGHQVCFQLKQRTELRSIPVLFLTARDDEKTEIQSLDAGGDDFLTKPVSISRLLTRIRALLRRSNHSENGSPDLIRFDELSIDKQRYVVTLKGENIQLPRKEFELLFYLATRAGKVINRQLLLDEIWGKNVYVIDRTVDVHIRKIREKIGDHYIQTIRGVGYRFQA